MDTPIVDTHMHFWDLDRFEYEWLGPEWGILNRSYLPDQFKRELEGAGVDHGVFVQANHLQAENDWVLGLAEENDWIAGIVGWVDLTDPNVDAVLDRYSHNPRFKGVRHLIQNEEDDRWLLRHNVQPGLAALAARDLSFDIVALPRHLPHMPECIGRHPDLSFIIDHMGKPPIASGNLEAWARDLEKIALFPNVFCKVSGLITEAVPDAWTPEDLKPAIGIAIERFGFDRLMFGGDWPVSLLASSYKAVVDTTKAALGDITEENGAKFWGRNAARFYRLDLKGVET